MRSLHSIRPRPGISSTVYAEKLAETCAVDNLVLDLFVDQTIITLQKNDFEH